MSDEKASILGGKSPGSSVTSNDPNAIYHDSSQSPRARLLQILFVGIVVLMVLICIILSIYRGVLFQSYGAMYFMLGVSLIGFVFVELCLKNGIPQTDYAAIGVLI